MRAPLWCRRPAFAWLALLPALLLFPLEARAASPSVNLDQVRNGGDDSPTDPGSWQNGNLNATQAHYVEGWSVAYRVVLTDVPTGSPITLTLGYDIKHSDAHALDYLTHYDRLEPHLATFGHEKETVDPLIGTGLTMAAPMSTFPIPAPTSVGSPVAGQPATSFSALPADQRVMTMWNGSIESVSYQSEGDLTENQDETQIDVTFTPTSSTVVLAWGGHIASRRDWGFEPDGTPMSAAGISGSPYHMRVIGWTLGNLGQQDRSLAAAAVFPPPMCEITGQGLLCEGDMAVYQAMTDDPSATYEWSFLSNTAGATFVGSSTDTTATVETAGAGQFELQLTISSLTGTSVCDTLVTVTALPSADAGSDIAVCSVPFPEVVLSGSIGGGAGSALWSTSGTGSFDDAGDPGTTYYPSEADILGGSVVLTLTTDDPEGPCTAAADSFTLTITEAATVDAGDDQEVCSLPAPMIDLSGSFGGGASSVTWTTSGTGFFDDASDPTTTYTPSEADIAAGTITLTLTTDNPGDACGAAFDEMVVTLSPVATVAAGDDQEVCSLPDPTISLSGSFGGGAAIATWTTSGSGTFGDPNDPGTSYEPSAADIAAGTVTLTFTTNDPVGPCDAAADSMVLTIHPAAEVDAGEDVAVCSDPVPTIDLNGFFGGGATGVLWSTSGSGTFGDEMAAMTTYTPSAADVASGSVTLVLATADPAGPCGAAVDSLLVTIAPAATANAGADQVLCSLPAPIAQLAGSFNGGASSALWTTSGSGAFEDANDPETTYTPSAEDIGNGTVTLTLTTNDPDGSCGAASDEMVLGFLPAATVAAGSDLSVCAIPAPVLDLAGSFGGGASGVTWTTSGTGAFDDASDPKTTYTPSAEDIATGSVVLTLTTDDPDGPCGEVSDELLVTIHPVAVADAGDDQEGCAMPPPVFELAGTMSGSATSCTWTTSGSGSFGNTAALATTYTPSQADLDAGSVVLTLTTDDPDGPCPAGSDEVELTIFPLPDCDLAYPDVLPFVGSTGNELSAPSGMSEYLWNVSGNGTMTGGQGTDTVTYDVGPNLGIVQITLTMTDQNGCQNTCEISLYVAEPGSVVCSFTQGFYGNRGGKFNSTGTLNLIRSVLGTPLVLGDATRGFEIPFESADCVIQRLPSGTTPTTLPVAFGYQTLPADDCQTDPGLPVDSSGKWENNLLGQTTANSLNVRVDPGLPDVRLCLRFVTVKALPGPDGILGTDDDLPSGDPDDVRVWTIPQAVLDRLGANTWVSGLLELANSALAGHEDPGLISAINHAVSTINEAFDGCRFVVEDCRIPRNKLNTLAKDDMGTLPALGGALGDPLGGGPTIDLPSEFALYGPRPNPVRQTAEIRFDLPSASTVALEIFDVSGRRVRVLENGSRAAGRHVLAWDGRDGHGPRVAAGIYFYRMQAGDFREIRKMVVLR
jgi:hypothetical protein